MIATAEIGAGTGVSLEQMLAARDRRCFRQSLALARFDKPIVSMTVVMPGPVKDGSLTRRVMEVALGALEAMANARYWPVIEREVYWQETGPEAIYVIDAKPWPLKAAAVALEDQHPLGRFWDLDILGPGQGGLSRRALGLPARRCLICDRPAFECSRSRRHPLEELLDSIRKAVRDHDLHSAA